MPSRAAAAAPRMHGVGSRWLNARRMSASSGRSSASKTASRGSSKSNFCRSTCCAANRFGASSRTIAANCDASSPGGASSFPRAAIAGRSASRNAVAIGMHTLMEPILRRSGRRQRQRRAKAPGRPRDGQNWYHRRHGHPGPDRLGDGWAGPAEFAGGEVLWRLRALLLRLDGIDATRRPQYFHLRRLLGILLLTGGAALVLLCVVQWIRGVS